METEQYNYTVEESQENNLKDLLLKYVINWKWFLLSICLSLFLGYYYLRFKTPMYEVTASILVKDNTKGENLSELSAFEDLGLLKKSNNIDDEIEMLKSRSLMTRVVKGLRLNVSYHLIENPIEVEKYGDAPITINFIANDSSIYDATADWIINIIDNKSFELKDAEGKSIANHTFGEVFSTEIGKVIITPNTSTIQEYHTKNIRIIVFPLKYIVDRYRDGVQVNAVNKTSNVISISLKDAVRDKASAVISNLIEQHNADAIEDKNLVSKNTAAFINERIKYITDELYEVEGEVEGYKTKHKLVDVESEAKLFLQSGSLGELSLLEANTQASVADLMYNYLIKHTAPTDLVPSNLGISDISIASSISDYNKLVLERNRICKNSSDKNPVVENMDAQLINIRASLKESLLNLKNVLTIKIKELSLKENSINSKISEVPKYEREYNANNK
jgi:tyrosine-protein kinase Etk/Wzc